MSLHNLNNSRGQGLVEYLILVALLAVASIGITRVLGQQIKRKYAEITWAISGETKTLRAAEIPTYHYQKSDLKNFMKGAAKPRSDR